MFHLFCCPLVVFYVVTSWAVILSAQEVQVFFSPHGRCARVVSDCILHSESSVYVAAYVLSHPEISASILDAHSRGLDVGVLVDPRQKSYKSSLAPSLALSGVPVYVDSKERIFHNKYVVIDRSITLTGSFNFTRAADLNNAENLILIRDRSVAEIFLSNWRFHFRHSVPLAVPPQPSFFSSPLPSKGFLSWHAFLVLSCRLTPAENSVESWFSPSGRVATTPVNW